MKSTIPNPLEGPRHLEKRPNILYLTHRVPYPPNRGDRIRSYHTLRFLAERANVYLGCLSEEPLADDALDVLNQLCQAVHVQQLGKSRWVSGAWALATGRSATEGLFRSPGLKRVVQDWMAEIHFDTVLVFCSSMYQFVPKMPEKKCRAVVDLVDVDSQKWLDYARHARAPKRLLFQLEGQRVRQLETRIADAVDAVTLVSEQEAALFQRIAGGDNIHSVTNGVDTGFFQPSGAASGEVHRHECVFVGVLDYRANVDGLRWFCREVWPQLRRRVPDATFRIVGRSPGEGVKALGELPGVEIVGEVSDVREHVRRAGVVVVPLKIARGIQNKVLEALAMGKPVVATPQALEGIAVEHSVNAVRAESAGDWIEAVATLFRDAEKCRQLGQSGRDFVVAHHSWEACLKNMIGLLSSRGDSRESMETEAVLETSNDR